MADDFTAVPDDRWRDLNGDVAFIRTFAFWTLILLVLLVLTLIEKGTLSGWGDLVRFAHE